MIGQDWSSRVVGAAVVAGIDRESHKRKLIASEVWTGDFRQRFV
jgi:hypothetical protein